MDSELNKQPRTEEAGDGDGPNVTENQPNVTEDQQKVTGDNPNATDVQTTGGENQPKETEAEPTGSEDEPNSTEDQHTTATGRYHRFLEVVKASGFDNDFSDIFSSPYPHSSVAGPFELHPCCTRLPTAGEDRASRVRSALAALLFKYPQVSSYKLETNGMKREKDDEMAAKVRAEGNKLYLDRNFNEAIAKYSESLRLSTTPPFPVNTDDLCYEDIVYLERIVPDQYLGSGEGPSPTRGLAYASRSAAFFEQARYRDCLIDIVRSIRNGYPKMRENRLLDRARKCREMIVKQVGRAILDEENRYYDQRRDEDSSALRMKADKDGFVSANWKQKISTSRASRSALSDDELYICEKVKVQVDPVKGRFMIAVETISPGKIVVVEPNPHVSVLECENEGTHCHHCYECRDNMIPCDNCATVMFCSQRCKDLAKGYHRRECSSLVLVSTDASLPVRHDVVRLFSSRGLTEFLVKQQDIRAAMRSNFCGGAHIPRIVKPNSQASPNQSIPALEDFFGLMHHSEKLDATNVFSGVALAVYLIKCLELLGFFHEYDQQFINDFKRFAEVRLYIAELLYYSALIIMTNSHAIKELVFHLDEMWESDTRAVAAGCYDVTTYINHSCVPNCVRDYCANRIIIRTLRRIPKGAELTMLYAKSFTLASKADRNKYLQENFQFECQCVACENDWPKMENMTVLPYDRAGRPCPMCVVYASGTNCVPNVGRCDTCKSKLDSVTCYIDDEWTKVINFLRSGHGVAIEDHSQGTWAAAQKIFMDYMTTTENVDPDRPYFDFHLCQELLTKCLQIRGRLG